MIIAIDGPAGSGKSTVSKLVAKRLDFFYLDTGAMYRALTVEALDAGIDLNDEIALTRLAKEAIVDLESDEVGETRVIVNGRDVTTTIRKPEVTNQVKFVARVPSVRGEMVESQRRIAGTHSVVLEGRDATTVIFPNANLKIYLDASQEERAHRRFKELAEKGIQTSFEAVLLDQKERDKSDFERDVGPLRKAHDAIVIDTTDLTIEQVVDHIVELASSRRKSRPS